MADVSSPTETDRNKYWYMPYNPVVDPGDFPIQSAHEFAQGQRKVVTANCPLVPPCLYPQPGLSTLPTTQSTLLFVHDNHVQALDFISSSTAEPGHQAEAPMYSSTQEQPGKRLPRSKATDDAVRKNKGSQRRPSRTRCSKQESAGPFRCEIEHCTYPGAFTTMSSLGRHKNEQHISPYPFPCSVCDKNFQRKERLATHMQKAHAEQA